MYKRILVPLDGSQLAEQVLPYAFALARALEAKVELLQVFSAMPGPTDPEPSLRPYRVEENARAAAVAYLNGISTSYFRDLDASVVCTVRRDNPASWIVDEGGQEPDTLIAMTTHGRSGIARAVLGSVTDQVLHATSSPLLLVRAREQQPDGRPVELRHLIAPLDGSRRAEQSLSHVAGLAKALALTVVLTLVAPSENRDVTTYLGRVAEWLDREGVKKVEQRPLAGDPASCIIDLAHGLGSSLAVMMTHGRSGIGRSLLGSVTDQVVRRSGGPVLVIRSQL